MNSTIFEYFGRRVVDIGRLFTESISFDQDNDFKVSSINWENVILATENMIDLCSAYSRWFWNENEFYKFVDSSHYPSNYCFAREKSRREFFKTAV